MSARIRLIVVIMVLLALSAIHVEVPIVYHGQDADYTLCVTYC